MRAALGRAPAIVRSLEEAGNSCPLPMLACVMVVWPCLQSREELRRLVDFKALHPLAGLVLVTRRDPQLAKLIQGTHVGEFVWLEEVERGLPRAVDRAVSASFLSECMALIRNAPTLSPRIKDGLIRALTSSTPILSVKKLLQDVGGSRQQMWREWRRSARTPVAPSLKDLLRLVVLLRATVAKSHLKSWEAVAADLKVSTHTLRRAAGELMATTLSRLASAGVEPVADEVRRLLTLLVTDSGERSESPPIT